MPPFRLICILILGFSSGLPLALTGSTLQAWLAVENVDIKTIGLYAVVGFPYTYKFLWSPFLDYLKPGFFDQRRGWIALMQLACAGLIATMAFVDAHSAWTVATVAVAIAFCSSTQDMAIDAYRTDLLPAPERGLGAAYYVTGYRVAMLVSGGLALILAGEYLGWTGTYLLMAALIGACAVITALSPTSDTPEDLARRAAKKKLFDIVKESTRNFMSKEAAIWILLLIVLYKVGDAFAGSLTTAFLLKGLGFTLTEVGAVNKTVSLIATLLGAFLGGALMTRMGLYGSLMLFGIFQAVSNLSFWVLSVIEPSIWAMGSAVFVENLCGGMGTAAFVGLLTSLCSKEFSATQYALLSSLAAMGRVYLAAPAGYVVAAYGWSDFFIFSTAAAVPGLVALYLLRSSIQKLAR
ncbi:MAG: AmpG family muropeptide MFS transporter [Limnobacter sp. CACIAM 66H1]|uniref:AmpG family muropeptide MFS transporter n=1 Tax=Limnobacter sp. CACIAM 66H1 TaxID=1813033 RepID=UPI0007A8B8FA|nr:MFS transporter [Limnobacter sp. CACIAM 66H1]KYP10595.1 MAG: AmpG family muropeptide MFS transporter [Limnobacter sp. CACIAM 66H1]